MQQSTASTSQSNGGIFGRGASIFGGGSKTPTATRTASSSSAGGSNDSSSYSAAISKGAEFVRKASFSANPKNSNRADRGRKNSIATEDLGFAPRKRSASIKNRAANLVPPIPSTLSPPSPADAERETKSTDSVRPVLGAEAATNQEPGTDSATSTAPYNNMLSGLSSANQAVPYGLPVTNPPSPTLETITYQHIQEMASKRMQTLYYLRKVHEGRVYWFNTVLFNKNDLQRMPYFEPRKLARRATNYLLLGLSLPVVLDINASSPLELLRTLNALFAEFESFQQVHPPDGSASSLTRGRFPQMFKRSNVAGAGRRRTSSAADIGLPMGSENADSKSSNGGISAGTSTTAVPLGEADLLPGEEYTHLLTPSLPFDPDFYETFATLCDVLIDCYTKLMALIPAPRDCTPVIAELFTKMDARVRKIIVQGVVKEFEEGSRVGVRGEIAGVGKVVLGALM
ncbi:hypothetical protein F5884DRAFT_70842 [Xylogone sp. PMI_703]|nr:hypothetical protein F5884DRAFT_70842 [Xylogone sp. PMI_703]